VLFSLSAFSLNSSNASSIGFLVNAAFFSSSFASKINSSASVTLPFIAKSMTPSNPN
jgi:hypothetical protein